jgi:hypothetical protein
MSLKEQGSYAELKSSDDTVRGDVFDDFRGWRRMMPWPVQVVSVLPTRRNGRNLENKLL